MLEKLKEYLTSSKLLQVITKDNKFYFGVIEQILKEKEDNSTYIYLVSDKNKRGTIIELGSIKQVIELDESRNRNGGTENGINR